jgi:hypothetical protein
LSDEAECHDRGVAENLPDEKIELPPGVAHGGTAR